MTMHGDKELWLGALRADGAAMRTAFEEAAAGAGLTATVPSCPEWTVLALVHHTGEQYQWVRSHVSRGTTSRPENVTHGPGELPTGPAAVQWWTDEYEALLEVFDAVDPELPAWNWAPRAKQAAFWFRRMAHETAVHRWDAQTAVGHVEPIEATLAVDTISEVLDSWLPAGRRRGPTDRSGMVQLAATDVEVEWFLRLRGEGVALLDTATWLDHDDHRTRVLARGTASDMALALWGRVPFDILEISGETDLLEPLRVS
jgi:uncharacterized protein (TIGR03083 family)